MAIRYDQHTGTIRGEMPDVSSGAPNLKQVSAPETLSSHIDGLGETIGSLMEVLGRLRGLGNRIVGARPEEPPNIGQEESPDLLTKLGVRRAKLDELIAELRQENARIERAL